MKSLKLLLPCLLAVVCLFAPMDLHAQEAETAVEQETTLVQPFTDDVVYFATSTDEEKAFVRACHRVVDADKSLHDFQRKAFKRKLKRKWFVRRVKLEKLQEMYWENPSDFHIVGGKLVHKNGIIDWDNIDVDKLRDIIEIIKGLIEFISGLFSGIDLDGPMHVCLYPDRVRIVANCGTNIWVI